MIRPIGIKMQRDLSYWTITNNQDVLCSDMTLHHPAVFIKMQEPGSSSQNTHHHVNHEVRQRAGHLPSLSNPAKEAKIGTNCRD